MTLDITKIVQARFPENQFYTEKNTKKQIVIHHTVSNGNAKNVQNGWAKNPERVGTAFIIDGDGVIYQCFSSSQWAHHLGTKLANNTLLNQQSIGIEVCNWGGLTKKNNKYFNFVGAEIDVKDVVDYGQKWHGYQYYQKYSDKQIESLRQLIVYLCDTYNISKEYDSAMWELCNNATSGKNGIYTHVSYRKDKSDMHPQIELKKMLQELSK